MLAASRADCVVGGDDLILMYFEVQPPTESKCF